MNCEYLHNHFIYYSGHECHYDYYSGSGRYGALTVICMISMLHDTLTVMVNIGCISASHAPISTANTCIITLFSIVTINMIIVSIITINMLIVTIVTINMLMVTIVIIMVTLTVMYAVSMLHDTLTMIVNIGCNSACHAPISTANTCIITLFILMIIIVIMAVLQVFAVEIGA